jgi:hypothetical protein
MIHKAKDLSPDQKMAIESVLGRSVADTDIDADFLHPTTFPCSRTADHTFG